MSPNFIQEELSWAYVRAVVFRAGFNLSMPVKDVMGIDGTVVSFASGVNRVDFQLKSTTTYSMDSGNIGYDLRVEDYNRLVKVEDVPRVLILFIMPADDSQWLEQTNAELCLRNCAYWVSLMGRSPSSNVSSVRVSVPLLNMLDQGGLQTMFDQLL